MLNDGQTLVSSSNASIIIWNLKTYNKINTLTEHTKIILCFKLLNNERLASGSKDTTIIIWNTTNWQVIYKLKGHNNTVSTLVLLNNEIFACSINALRNYFRSKLIIE